MKTRVYDLSGEIKGEIELPKVFEEEYRPDLIKRAVLAMQSHRYQPYGPHKYSGMNTSARGWGTGRGVSRVPRIRGSSRAARVPQAVGGRRAHPPKPEKNIKEKINKKERRKAIKSAIAATANLDLVRARGHKFFIGSDNTNISLPIVVDNDFENLTKTKEVQKFLEEIDVFSDVMRAKNGRTIRAGKGKRRGRKYKKRKSILIVYGSDNGISRGARNLSGVDVVSVDNLNAELLAPGTHAGRLTIYSENAISKLGDL
ncbi:MAG TPA: 50S ribosomal protein L4 [Methanosarcinales archaeon]|nr:50S ribosomal protein L4 [Methanosarcinales archaeon]